MQQASKPAPAAVVSNLGGNGSGVAVSNGGGSNDAGGGGGNGVSASDGGANSGTGVAAGGSERQPVDQRAGQPLVSGTLPLHKPTGTPRPAIITSSGTSSGGNASGAAVSIGTRVSPLPAALGNYPGGHALPSTITKAPFQPGSAVSIPIGPVAPSQLAVQHLIPIPGQSTQAFSDARPGLATGHIAETAGGAQRFSSGPSQDKGEQSAVQQAQAIHSQGQGKVNLPPHHSATIAVATQLPQTLSSNIGVDKEVYITPDVLASQAKSTTVLASMNVAERTVSSKSSAPHPDPSAPGSVAARGQMHNVVVIDGLQKKTQGYTTPVLNANPISSKPILSSNSLGGSQAPVPVAQPATVGKNQQVGVRKPVPSGSTMKPKLPPQNAGGVATGSVGTTNVALAQKKPLESKRRKPSKAVDKPKTVVKSQASSIAQEDPASTQKLSTADALSYLKTVKEKFKHNRQVYDDFLQIMKAFKASEVEIEEVIGRVKTLFKDHKELILGFNTFLPKGYEITLPPKAPPEETERQPVEFNQAITYVNKIKSRFEKDERVYRQFLDILHQYRKEQKSIKEVYEEVERLFKSHTDLLQEFTFFLPDSHSKGPVKTEKGAKLQSGATESKVPGGRQFKKSSRKSNATASASQGPSNQADLPTSAVQGSQQRKLKRSESTQAAKAEMVFLTKVKQRLRSADAYHQFIKCLHTYSQEVISKAELEEMVRDILRTTELMSDFKKFLERCESSGRPPATLVDIETDKNGRSTTLNSQGSATARLKMISSREKMTVKPISELDLSNCDRCGPSYRKLPPDYPRGRCSGRNGTHRELLNDDWVSITSGQEDNNTYRSENGNAANEGQGFRRNQYEENLFRCEDDRYELDMMIETNDSCIRSMNRLNEKINEMDIKQKNQFMITNELSPFHYRVIERIYGDHGADIVAHLRKNPAVAVPVILSRVKQKIEEWRKVKEEMNKVWREIYEKNYFRSLDHRSFHFKQVDKRLVSAKGLASEIRDISEKKRKDDFMSVSSLKKRTAPPDLAYPFRDITVMYEVCEVVKYCASESLNDDSYDKAIKVYESVVEEIFGVSATERSQYLKQSNSEGLRFDKNSKEDSVNSGAKDDNEAQGETGDVPDGDETAGKEAITNQEQNSDPDDTDPADPDGEGADDAEESGMQDVCEKGSAENGKEESSALERFNLFPLGICPSGIGSGRTKSKKVLFANESLFVLFRMVQILYERLFSAKQAASKSSWNPEAEHSSSSVYRCYLDTLGALLDGSIDHGKYEDRCRAMLGAASYNLSTLDKVALKLVKQLVHVGQDEVATKLQGLYKYEHARNHVADVSVYYANACMMLNDDAVFRIDCAMNNVKSEQQLKTESSESSTSLTLSFYMLENKIDKEIIGAMGAHDHEFTNYVHSFVQSEAGEMKESRVYLGRLLRDSPDAEPDLSNCQVANQLECKLQSKGKITYVLDTEDIFVRLKSAPSNNQLLSKDSDSTEQQAPRKRMRSFQNTDSVQSPRSKRFRSWLETTSLS